MLFRSPPRQVILKDIPYFSQWESPELVGDILSGKRRAQDDPKWKNSGASSQDEYAEWSWAGCGMACTKMILAASGAEAPPLVALAKQSLKYGVYQLPLESSPGMFYKPYVEFMKKEYGLRARITKRLSSAKIMRALAHGNLVIASVSPEIRNPAGTPTKRGGHLVLIVGYDKPKQEFYIHNPSGNTEKSQTFAVVSFADFDKFAAGRGVIVGR